jgi:hypothetical protein
MSLPPSEEIERLELRADMLRTRMRVATLKIKQNLRPSPVSGNVNKGFVNSSVIETALSLLKTVTGNRSISALAMFAVTAWLQKRLLGSTARKSSKQSFDTSKDQSFGSARTARTPRSKKHVSALAASGLGIIGLAIGAGLSRLVPASSWERTVVAQHTPQVAKFVESMIDQSMNSAKQTLTEGFGLARMLAAGIVFVGLAASYAKNAETVGK